MLLFFRSHLSYLEPPQWGRDSDLTIVGNNPNGSLSKYGDCEIILSARGTTADGDENQAYYPNFNLMLLSIEQSKCIELVCVFIIFLFLVLKMGDDGFVFKFFFYPGNKRYMHSFRLITLACLLAGNLSGYTVLSPFFRMLILASHLRRFLREFCTLWKMVRRVSCGKIMYYTYQQRYKFGLESFVTDSHCASHCCKPMCFFLHRYQPWEGFWRS